MKNLIRCNYGKSLIVSVMLTMISFVTFAQDKSTEIDVNVNKGGNGGWYTQPWVWVVGGAIFLLLLIAILRGGNNNRN